LLLQVAPGGHGIGARLCAMAEALVKTIAQKKKLLILVMHFLLSGLRALARELADRASGVPKFLLRRRRFQRL
jgi:hypothetical protein